MLRFSMIQKRNESGNLKSLHKTKANESYEHKNLSEFKSWR